MNASARSARQFGLLLGITVGSLISSSAFGQDETASEPIRRLGSPGRDRLSVAAQFDYDGNGVANKKERQAARLHVHQLRKDQRIAEVMRNDKNGDGRVTADERSSDGRRRRGPSLESADLDGDGAIDEHEAGELVYQSRYRQSVDRDFDRAERLYPTSTFDDGSGLYDEGVVRTFFLQFEDDEWMDELHDFYRTDVSVPGDLMVNGDVYKNVGVRYRGNSSFGSVPPELKRSLDIEIDHDHKKQRLFGYKTINLLNAHGDPTLMREVLYSKISRQYIPAFRANFVKLVINGESWGVYPNIQQYNKDFLEDWFGSRGGVRWKGRGSLTYEGPDRASYEGYIAKTDDVPDQAWDDLVELCRVLKETPDEQLERVLNPIFNIDGALWSIALENVFVDEGYLIRGSDYNLFQDENRRFHLLQHDGNEVLSRPGGPGMPRDMIATELPPYHLADDDGRPVVHRLLSIPNIRARYTAHVRTIIDDWLHWSKIGPEVERFRALIDAEVKKDVRTESSYDDFARAHIETVGRVLGIKEFVDRRREFLLANEEVSRPAPEIAAMTIQSRPVAGQNARVQVKTGPSVPIDVMRLYWAPKRHAPFEYVQMFDDGAHADGESGDGLYGGEIPAQPVGTQVHYYVEGRADSHNPVITYYPSRAEAGAFTYIVQQAQRGASQIVINEVMAQNQSTIQDPQGEYDDWIELHNKGEQDIDLTGMYLTDTPNNPRKYRFPEGTTITSKGYLIVWADEHGKATPGLHANFKLSQRGEIIRLIDSDERGNRLLDEIVFGPLDKDQSIIRGSDGNGTITVSAATPGTEN